MIRPLPHIAALHAYVLADLTAPQGKPLISLSQNESLRPPNPDSIRAAANAAADAALYPDPDWYMLRHALARHHGIPAADILCGGGSLDLIGCLTRAYAGPAHAVLAPAHAYPFFRTATQLAQARFDTAPEEGLTVSVDTLLACVQPDTRIVFVANPGNPTGTRISRTELVRLRECLPGNVMLVIDEAYGEFADHLGEPVFELVARGDTVVLRTFSKAYGLAGFRVGWGLFPPDIAAQTRKVMNPNTISSAAQAAATAALQDQNYMRETCDMTAAKRDALTGRLREIGLEVAQSHTNFVLITFRDPGQAQAADVLLRAEGVFLRAQTGAGLGHALRATIGADDALDRVVTLLEQFLSKGTP